METLRGGFPTEDFAGSLVEHFLVGGEDLVLGHLFALVVGQAQAQGLGYLQEPTGEYLPHARGVFLGASGKASYD